MEEYSNIQNAQYANYTQRVVAVIIDSILESIVTVLTVIATAILANILFDGHIVFVVVMYIVSVFGFSFWNRIYLLNKKGASLGKQAMSIRVVSQDTQEHVGIGRALLRETVGKIFSAIILYIGFLMPLWDKRKQGLHDKVAGTIVLKR